MFLSNKLLMLRLVPNMKLITEAKLPLDVSIVSFVITTDVVRNIKRPCWPDQFLNVLFIE